MRPSKSPSFNFILESLETRRLFAATIVHPIAPVTVAAGATTTTLDVTNDFTDPTLAAGTLVEFQTTLGNIEVQLTDSETPLTVANFLNYVDSGAYNGTIIHRSLPGFVVQGGGFTTDGTAIPTNAPVQNEPGLSNVAGTIAMAKLSGDPNSATSQWFFNVGDNSQNLDNQNGGFTVFGNVIAGLNVITAINNLTTTTATLGGQAQTDVPVKNLATGATPTAANFVQVESVAVVPNVTLRASSDSGLVSATINGGQLTLTSSSDAPGYAHVTVSASSSSGASVKDTFRVHVLADSAHSFDVSIGGSHPGTVVYEPTNNGAAHVTLIGPGTAVAHFTGDDISSNGGVISGRNLQLDSLTATGTTLNSTINVAVFHTQKTVTSVGDISTTGSLGQLFVTRAELVGDFTATGGVRLIRADAADNGTITIGSGSQLQLIRGEYLDENLTSAEPIGQILADNWSNSDTVSETIAAPFITRLKSFGNMTPGIDATGVGTKAQAVQIIGVRGFLGGTWNVAGGIHALVVGGLAPDFNADFTNKMTKVIVGTFGGSLTAASIGRVRVEGSMTEGELVLSQPFALGQRDLGALTVRGNMDSSLVKSAGNIGTVTLRGMSGSGIFAGIATLASGQEFPASAADFASPAHIDSITSTPSPTSVGFEASVISASSIGPMALGTTFTNENGNPFGFAAQTIDSLSLFDKTKKRQLSFTKLTSAAAVTSQVNAQKYVLADLQVNIV